jgi:hypothetical protein
MLFASPSLATESRVEALGGIGLYLPDEDTNQFIFPTTMSQHVNNAYAEIGSFGTPDAMQTGGATFHMPRLDVNAGLYLNRAVPAGTFNHAGYTGALNLNRYHLLMVQKGSAALGLALGGDSSEDKFPEGTGNYEESGSIFGILAGWEGNLFGEAKTEVGARVSIASGETIPDGDDNDTEESSLAFSLAARNHYDQGQNGKLIANIGFGFGSGEVDPQEPDGTTADGKTEISGLSFGIGLGWHYPVSRNATVVMVVEPFSFASGSSEETATNGDKEETEMSTLSYPSFFLGVETWLNSWLQGRMGVGQVFSATTMTTTTTPEGDESSEVESTNADSSFEISFGFGIKVSENWTIDGVFNDRNLFTGPDFVSGNGSSSGNLLTRVSVNGSWD